MSWIYEITLQGVPAAAKSAADWFARGPRDAWASLPELLSLDTYIGAGQAVADPYNNDGQGPLLIVVAEFGNQDAPAAIVKKRAWC